MAETIPTSGLWQSFRKRSVRLFKLLVLLSTIAVIGYCSTSWLQSRRCPLYLLNGLSTPYQVTVNGTMYTLLPGLPQKISVVEGNQKIAASEIPGSQSLSNVVIERDFISRPISHKAFVVNPDGAAILEVTRHIYNGRYRAMPSQVPTGYRLPSQRFHALDDIDFLFQEPPEIIGFGKNYPSKQVTKTTLSVVRAPSNR